MIYKLQLVFSIMQGFRSSYGDLLPVNKFRPSGFAIASSEVSFLLFVVRRNLSDLALGGEISPSIGLLGSLQVL